jgi:hypothetical protein
LFNFYRENHKGSIRQFALAETFTPKGQLMVTRLFRAVALILALVPAQYVLGAPHWVIHYPTDSVSGDYENDVDPLGHYSYVVTFNKGVTDEDLMAGKHKLEVHSTIEPGPGQTIWRLGNHSVMLTSTDNKWWDDENTGTPPPAGTAFVAGVGNADAFASGCNPNPGGGIPQHPVWGNTSARCSASSSYDGIYWVLAAVTADSGNAPPPKNYLPTDTQVFKQPTPPGSQPGPYRYNGARGPIFSRSGLATVYTSVSGAGPGDSHGSASFSITGTDADNP